MNIEKIQANIELIANARENLALNEEPDHPEYNNAYLKHHTRVFLYRCLTTPIESDTLALIQENERLKRKINRLLEIQQEDEQCNTQQPSES